MATRSSPQPWRGPLRFCDEDSWIIASCDSRGPKRFPLFVSQPYDQGGNWRSGLVLSLPGRDRSARATIPWYTHRNRSDFDHQLAVEAIKHVLSLTPPEDEVSFREDRQMPRNGGLREGKLLYYFIDALGAICKLAQDRSPSRVRQCLKDPADLLFVRTCFKRDNGIRHRITAGIWRHFWGVPSTQELTSPSRFLCVTHLTAR